MNERRAAKPEARLEAWQLIRTSAPSSHLLDIVFGHAQFMDARIVLTSDLIDVRADAVRGVRVETLNTLYRLGEPGSGSCRTTMRARKRAAGRGLAGRPGRRARGQVPEAPLAPDSPIRDGLAPQGEFFSAKA